ncbi:hypothetical protein HPB51_029565 [Rhipicephalus microplus]|uniref:Uncharacterized protein n=1 Tax=Rhipicephalus microplus TaxID=6941 RepID=A0A9J6CU07_RHIMP|nr:hypothetical protein HPB51_029565 [Rhipicephalus microplus]
MPVIQALQERHVRLQAVCDFPTILATGLRQRRAMHSVSSTPVSSGPKPEPSGTACIAKGLLSVWCLYKSAQAPPQLNMLRKKWHKEGYKTIGTTFFSVPSLVWIKRVAQNGCNTAVCRNYAVALAFSHAHPNFNSYRCECGNWAQGHFQSVLELLLEASQRVVTGMAMRTQAPARTQNLSLRAARTNTNCIAVLCTKEREELREENKKDGDSRPLVSSPGGSGMDQQDASRLTTMYEIRLLGGHAFKSIHT